MKQYNRSPLRSATSMGELDQQFATDAFNQKRNEKYSRFPHLKKKNSDYRSEESKTMGERSKYEYAYFIVLLKSSIKGSADF